MGWSLKRNPHPDVVNPCASGSDLHQLQHFFSFSEFHLDHRRCASVSPGQGRSLIVTLDVTRIELQFRDSEARSRHRPSFLSFLPRFPVKEIHWNQAFESLRAVLFIKKSYMFG